MKNSLKVAIVCDWLLGIGGAERVVLELHKLYPEAPIYTSQYDPHKIDWFNDADVRTTWLQKLPGGLKKFLPPLRALSFSRLDLSQYDLVLSASGAEAKGVKTGPNTVHINYCHSPVHYYWIRYDEYLHNPGFGRWNWLARLGLRLLVGPLRWWDFRAAQRPNVMIANSTHTAAQIEKFYKRPATVVFPPVDIERFQPVGTTARNGFVALGRQTPYKHIDLAVVACTKLKLPLTVLGNGPEHERLRAMAGPTVQFVANADDTTVAEHLKTANALLFPGMEDFGITAVEALAAGTPVIAYKAGGALDYIQPGLNGAFFAKQSAGSLIQALRDSSGTAFDPQAVAKTAERFSAAAFAAAMREVIQNSTSKST